MPGLVAMAVRVAFSGSTYVVHAFPHTTVGDLLHYVASGTSSPETDLYAYNKTALLHVKERLFDVFPDNAVDIKLAPPTVYVFDTIIQTAFDACFYMHNLFKSFPRDASQTLSFTVVHPLVPSMHASFSFTGVDAIFCIFGNHMAFPVNKSADGAFRFLCERGYFDGLTSNFGPQATQFAIKVAGPLATQLQTQLARALTFGLRYPTKNVFFIDTPHAARLPLPAATATACV